MSKNDLLVYVIARSKFYVIADFICSIDFRSSSSVSFHIKNISSINLLHVWNSCSPLSSSLVSSNWDLNKQAYVGAAPEPIGVLINCFYFFLTNSKKLPPSLFYMHRKRKKLKCVLC